METTVYDQFKKVLEPIKDVKVKIGDEEKTLLETVVYWEEGVEKTKAANKDLTAQRETWEKTEKEFKKALSDITATKADLERKLEESSGKGKKTESEKKEWEQQLNAVNDQLKGMNEKLQAAEKLAKDNEVKAQQANEKASRENLSSDLLKELSEYKIVGSQADFAITAILAKGFAKITADSETGLYKRSFITNKDGKELAADIKSLCKWFAEQNQFLVSASGKTGTGMQHQSGSPDKNGNNQNYYGMIQQK
jgi:chromosome segregation ATPase